MVWAGLLLTDRGMLVPAGGRGDLKSAGPGRGAEQVAPLSGGDARQTEEPGQRAEELGLLKCPS